MKELQTILQMREQVELEKVMKELKELKSENRRLDTKMSHFVQRALEAE